MAANVKELASSELAMHASLMSWVASMDVDSFVRCAKETPQRAANLYVDGAFSPADVVQVVLALEQLSQGFSELCVEDLAQAFRCFSSSDLQNVS